MRTAAKVGRIENAVVSERPVNPALRRFTGQGVFYP